MVVFNYTGRELSSKIVYYGPALSGKTTNLEFLYSQTPANTRGKMVSMKTKAERTLFFDLLPINRGSIGDFKVRFLLYTVPGQVYYNATRKLVLKGADAIVFVADSQRSQLAANMDSLRNLRTNLLEYGMCLDDLPWVISYNKRDMPDAMPMEELERELNPFGVPSFPSCAVSGEGVFESFEKIGEMLMQRLEVQLRGDSTKASSRSSIVGRPSYSTLDAGAVREVGEAIQSGASTPNPVDPPPGVKPRPQLASPGPAAAPSEELILTDSSLGMSPLAGSPGAPQSQPVGSAPTAVAGEREPLVIQKSIVVPVPAHELDGGKRKVRLVLDVTLDPNG